MKTPCIGACKNEGGICSGCYRTMDEVVSWQHITDEEREAAIAKLRGLQSTHTCHLCGKPAQCDISQGKESCWCFEIERRDTSSIDDKNAPCLCRKCLSALPIL